MPGTVPPPTSCWHSPTWTGKGNSARFRGPVSYHQGKANTLGAPSPGLSLCPFPSDRIPRPSSLPTIPQANLLLVTKDLLTSLTQRLKWLVRL